MATPITLFIIPNCGLEIDVDSNNDDTNTSIRYTVKNNHNLPLFDHKKDETFSGFLSPINKVTLPLAIKKLAAVPTNAKFFSFLHPPPELAAAIDWKSNRRFTKCNKEGGDPNTWGIPYVAILGAYVYFDSNHNVLRVNAISLFENDSNCDLRLTGPFYVTDSDAMKVRRSKRAQPLILDFFHEVGFVASAWIRPLEMSYRKSSIEKEDGYPFCKHGGFLFYRDDGSAAFWIIEPSGKLYHDGDVSALGDAFQSRKVKADILSNNRFVINNCLLDDRSKIRDEITIVSTGASEWKKEYVRSLPDEKTLLHRACYADCSAKIIEKLLRDESDNLLHKSEPYEWIPLMYAIRFKTKDVESILRLINACPQSVLEKDIYERSALHIACDSKASVEIVKALVDADKTHKVILQSTKYLGRLPVHISCNRNLPKDLISCLLESDMKSTTLHKKTKAGRLPLHCAIENKMPAEVISHFLGTNLRYKYHRETSEGSIELTLNDENLTSSTKPIYVPYQGMIPLHLACWNDSPPETIELLLEKDEDNRTVFQTIGASSWIVKDIDLLDEEDRKKRENAEHADLACLSKTSTIDSSSTLSLSSYDSEVQGGKKNTTHVASSKNFGWSPRPEIVAIHLAAKHGNIRVIELLIEKEKHGLAKKRRSTLRLKDQRGRCPLHIACESLKSNPSTIKQLLEADHEKATIYEVDERGYKAIHYTCDRQDANPKILQLLIEAEERYIAIKCSNSNDKINVKRMAQSCDNSKRSPLHLAVSCGTSDQVLQTLLEPNNFYLKGFDQRLITALASRSARNEKIQNYVIEKLSERCYFFLLFVDIYANAFALVFFLLGSERMIRGEARVSDPIILIICLIIFGSRTVIQIKSEPSGFFADAWNWCQLAFIVFLGLSTKTMIRNIGRDEVELNRNLFITCCTFLVVQFTFFLKATFLPFARFVGGLLMIFHTLVPFFIVSGLYLFAFAYGFYMSGGHEDNCQTMWTCCKWTLQIFFNGSDETSDVLDVVFGVVAIIILLNVLIAIVGEAWETAADQADHLFWQFRLQFLSEARFISHLHKILLRGRLKKVENFFDSFSDVKFVDRTHWTKEPYAQVKRKKQYDNPYHYFHEEVAEKIQKSHSLQADLFWVAVDSGRKKRDRIEEKLIALFTFMKWMKRCVMYLILLFCGTFTGGFTWPLGLRRNVLSFGLKSRAMKKKSNQESERVKEADKRY